MDWGLWIADYGLGIKHGLKYKTRTVYEVMSTETESTKPCFFSSKTLGFLITQGYAEKCLAFLFLFSASWHLKQLFNRNLFMQTTLNHLHLC